MEIEYLRDGCFILRMEEWGVWGSRGGVKRPERNSPRPTRQQLFKRIFPDRLITAHLHTASMLGTHGFAPLIIGSLSVFSPVLVSMGRFLDFGSYDLSAT